MPGPTEAGRERNLSLVNNSNGHGEEENWKRN